MTRRLRRRISAAIAVLTISAISLASIGEAFAGGHWG
jgi:hypothetical protein